MKVSSILLFSLGWVSSTSALPSPVQGPSCDCSGTKNGGSSAKQYICRDSRLGPRVLPKKLPLGTFVSNYDRFGDAETPGEFLAKWTDATGAWVYPPQNGFQLNACGDAINGTMVLEVGTLVDRFGSEYGQYVSAAAAPYSQRALPPSNLDTNPNAPDFPYNYHVYKVLKPLTVVGGPIAPWFGQPGLGAQFYTGGIGNILTLIDAGFLQREESGVLVSKEKGC
ncbi:hypothetical protein B0J13DRAFT_539287 [Dactylonectria estremocensis]|uniref:TNT domain-containing protein n=1 Tax=Dactylonectria estremocensis TaxID=1079267 RepID=A0A9P9FD79_9HYPO|nr:hypothetical protein B0J13DRAFT_539287 [Dactylonectria estremocensis]